MNCNGIINKMKKNQKLLFLQNLTPLSHRHSTKIPSIINRTSYLKNQNNPSPIHNKNMFLPINQYRSITNNTQKPKFSILDQNPTQVINISSRIKYNNSLKNGDINNNIIRKRDRYLSEQTIDHQDIYHDVQLERIHPKSIAQKTMRSNYMDLKTFQQIQISLIDEQKTKQFQQTKGIKQNQINQKRYYYHTAGEGEGGTPKSSSIMTRKKHKRNTFHNNQNKFDSNKQTITKPNIDYSKIKLSKLIEQQNITLKFDQSKWNKINKIPINYNKCCEYFQSQKRQLHKINPDEYFSHKVSPSQKKQSTLINQTQNHYQTQEQKVQDRLQSPKFTIKIGKQYYNEANNDFRKEDNYEDFAFISQRDQIKLRNQQISNKRKTIKKKSNIKIQKNGGEKYTPWEISNEDQFSLYQETYI